MEINRRKNPRIKVNRSTKIPVHIFPIIPFIGKPVEATSINMSAGGMALKISISEKIKSIKRGKKIKIHFRLPGHPLQECEGRVQHHFQIKDEYIFLGIKFTKISKKLSEELDRMAQDNGMCDLRIKEQSDPWCMPSCSYFQLCRKPIKPADNEIFSAMDTEITIQSITR